MFQTDPSELATELSDSLTVLDSKAATSLGETPESLPSVQVPLLSHAPLMKKQLGDMTCQSLQTTQEATCVHLPLMPSIYQELARSW
jgi:hypothetical protein